jgi:hypothetical protein
MNLDKLAKGHSHEPVCGLYACHVLTGRSLFHVKQWYKKKWGKSDRWRGSTHRGKTVAYIRKWKKLTPVKPEYKSVRKFVEMETTKKEKYLIYVSGHALCVVGGMVIDQGGPALPHESWNANKIIKDVYKVTSKPRK